MRKLLIFFLSFSLASLVTLLSSAPVSALSVREILGDSTIQQPLSIPPTAEGPGLILPNSHLFFLDQLKQEFRLFLAFTPEQKTKIHNNVAGERMSELRIMLAKNNTLGIEAALKGISDNFKAASNDLADAKLTGRNVSLLAKEINDSIKDKQRTLSVLEKQATGEIKAQVAATREVLKIAKVSVEGNLPADLLVNETIEDLNQQINDSINSASFSATEINRAIKVLTNLASDSAVQKQPEIKNVVSELQKSFVVLSEEASLKAPDKSAK